MLAYPSHNSDDFFHDLQESPVFRCVDHDPGRKSFVLGDHGKPGGRCQRCKFSDSELSNPGSAESWGPGVDHLLIRPDHKVLFQSFQVHTCTVISDLHFLRGDLDIDFGGVCIIDVVDQFPEQLDAFGVQVLADCHDMSFVDHNLKFSFFLYFHTLDLDTTHNKSLSTRFLKFFPTFSLAFLALNQYA